MPNYVLNLYGVHFPYIVCSFSKGSSKYLALNGESGEVTLTSEVSALTEDTVVELTAMATDHGEPPLNSTGP